MTTCKDFPKSSTSLANRCYLGRLGQFYFCVVGTSSSSSFLSRKEVFVSQNILRVTCVGLFWPLNLESPQASFPTTPITEHEKNPVHRGNKENKTGYCHLLNRFLILTRPDLMFKPTDNISDCENRASPNS